VDNAQSCTTYYNWNTPGCQTDVPHAFYFACGMSEVCPEEISLFNCIIPLQEYLQPGFGLDDEAIEFSGHWMDTFVCEQEPEDVLPTNSVKINSLVFCPKPFCANTGPHRMLTDFWYRGERYVIAAEEGPFEGNFIRENLFIQGLTEGAKTLLQQDEQYAITLLGIVFNAKTGGTLYPRDHHFRIFVYDDKSLLSLEGCTPSECMSKY
jgi:hypothetical protein